MGGMPPSSLRDALGEGQCLFFLEFFRAQNAYFVACLSTYEC